MDTIILNQSIQHLLRDKRLKNLINKYPIPQFASNDNYFDALSKSIIYQQLSGKVAKIIYTRFLALFEKDNPRPDQYLKINNSDLREIGLSKQKISYINNLSNFFINDNNLSQFKNLSEQEITNKLIPIKGIGQWTIDMFMIFTLCKTDILPIGDLGIKKAFKHLYNLQEFPTEQFMKEKSEDWRPYRTIACCYLWMIIDDGDI
jgi:DNA-3-methyladenine glycosylase II